MFVVTLKKAGLKRVGVGVLCCALVVFSAVLGRYISGRSGSEFMENIETYSLQKAEEEGMDPESYFLHTYTDNNGRHGGR